MRKFLFSTPPDSDVQTSSKYNGGSCMENENGVAIATGNYGIAVANGTKVIAIATGLYGAATALRKDSFALAWGIDSKVKGVVGSNIAAMFTDEDGIHIILKKVDDDKIKADTWYAIKNGELVIAE